MTRKKFQVWHMPASSDEPGEGHFAIQGPVDFDDLAACDTLAKQIEAILNAALKQGARLGRDGITLP
jgi:hypothetical protein